MIVYGFWCPMEKVKVLQEIVKASDCRFVGDKSISSEKVYFHVGGEGKQMQMFSEMWTRATTPIVETIRPMPFWRKIINKVWK